MKHRLIFAAMAAMLAAAAPASAQKAVIVNTDHDLRTNRAAGDVCKACHTPHDANPNSPALLWVPAVRTAGYTVYDSTVNPDFKGGQVNIAAGSQASLLCLSCHDGTVAVNVAWDGASNAAYSASKLTGNANIGTDLKNDHPIGFSYATSQAAKPDELAAAIPANLRLYGGQMECATCHNVHTPTNAPFLRMANTNSALCLGCHK